MARAISYLLKSGEVCPIPGLMRQIILLREENHKFAWPMVSDLISTFRSTIRDWITRWAEEQPRDQAARSPVGQFSGPNHALSINEKENVFQWIDGPHCKKGCGVA
jgi:hypothetical protein